MKTNYCLMLFVIQLKWSNEIDEGFGFFFLINGWNLSGNIGPIESMSQMSPADKRRNCRKKLFSNRRIGTRWAGPTGPNWSSNPRGWSAYPAAAAGGGGGGVLPPLSFPDKYF